MTYGELKELHPAIAEKMQQLRDRHSSIIGEPPTFILDDSDITGTFQFGVFNWDSEGWPETKFWGEVLRRKNFSAFYNRYPELTPMGENDKTPIPSPGKPDFKKITSSICSLLEYKNQKYGNSALEPLKVFSGKSEVGTRLDDKLARIKNSDVLKKNDVADMIGYLTLICAEKGWDDFEEFKD